MSKQHSKNFYIRLGIVLTIIIVSAIVIWSAWHTRNTAVLPLSDAATVYNNAVTQLLTNENLHYKVTQSKETNAHGVIAKETYSQTIIYESHSTENFRGYVEEDLIIGAQNIKSIEFYEKGNALFTTQGVNFQSLMDADNYKARYVPIAPINPDLYSEITGTTQAGISTITFLSPSAAEQWATTNDSIIIDSVATATIDKNGALIASNYKITYQEDNITTTIDVLVEVNNDDDTIPNLNQHEYISISDASIPKLLERSCGYLSAMSKVSANYTDTIMCSAFGDERTQRTTLSVTRDEDFSAEIDTDITIKNSSQNESATTSLRNDRFAKGVYSYSTDGVHFEINESVGQADVEIMCYNLLINTILHPGYIESLEIIDQEDTLKIVLTPTEAFSTILAEDACLILYSNATILSEQAQAFSTENITSYIEIDKKTGFPVSSGFYFSGSYDIGGIPYPLIFQADQQYNPAA